MCNANNHYPGCDCGWGGGHHNGGYHSAFQARQDALRVERLLQPLTREEPGYMSTSCPLCGEHVYFVRPLHGGSVWFDAMGPPWPKHGCFDRPSPIASRTAERFVVQIYRWGYIPAGPCKGDRVVLPNLTGKHDVQNENFPGISVPDLIARNVKWHHLDLTEGVFDRATMTESILIRCDLTGASLMDLNAHRLRLRRCILAGADLQRATLTRAEIVNCDLSGADLRDADLSGANLRGSNLSGADLSGADLSNADLTDVDLSSVRLFRTAFNGARGVHRGYSVYSG